MDTLELKDILKHGEDSHHQFKETVTGPDQLSAEFVAFSNASGGILLIGIRDNGTVVGVNSDSLSRLNQLISNVATNNVKPPITVLTEILEVDNKLVVIVWVREGANKPYCDQGGVYWVKSGADKRRVTAPEELQRLFQSSRKLFADESPIEGTGLGDIDKPLFQEFFQKQFGTPFEESGIPFEKLAENIRIAQNGTLRLGGLLAFGSSPQIFRPAFEIRAVNFFGTDIADTKFRDSENIGGNLSRQFENGMAFLLRNLKRIQHTEQFNQEGELEIPKIALEELLVNALVHRDYLINAPIKLFIFQDRVEIVSPGKLPNNLTIENIKSGNSIARNPILLSFASKLLPYRGIGSGIVRALKFYPNIEFENNIETETFKVTLRRPKEAIE